MAKHFGFAVFLLIVHNIAIRVDGTAAEYVRLPPDRASCRPVNGARLLLGKFDREFVAGLLAVFPDHVGRKVVVAVVNGRRERTVLTDNVRLLMVLWAHLM